MQPEQMWANLSENSQKVSSDLLENHHTVQFEFA